MAEFSAKTNLILTFAICGFANFSSIAIQLGVTGTFILLAVNKLHN